MTNSDSTDKKGDDIPLDQPTQLTGTTTPSNSDECLATPFVRTVVTSVPVPIRPTPVKRSYARNKTMSTSGDILGLFKLSLNRHHEAQERHREERKETFNLIERILRGVASTVTGGFGGPVLAW